MIAYVSVQPAYDRQYENTFCISFNCKAFYLFFAKYMKVNESSLHFGVYSKTKPKTILQ